MNAKEIVALLQRMGDSALNDEPPIYVEDIRQVFLAITTEEIRDYLFVDPDGRNVNALAAHLGLREFMRQYWNTICSLQRDISDIFHSIFFSQTPTAGVAGTEQIAKTHRTKKALSRKLQKHRSSLVTDEEYEECTRFRRLADGKPDPTIKDLAEPRHDISLGPFVVDETVLSELEREIHERLQNQPLPVLQIDEHDFDAEIREIEAMLAIEPNEVDLAAAKALLAIQPIATNDLEIVDIDTLDSAATALLANQSISTSEPDIDKDTFDALSPTEPPLPDDYEIEIELDLPSSPILIDDGDPDPAPDECAQSATTTTKPVKCSTPLILIDDSDSDGAARPAAVSTPVQQCPTSPLDPPMPAGQNQTATRLDAVSKGPPLPRRKARRRHDSNMRKYAETER